MKKFICLILALSLIMCVLASCGEEEKKDGLTLDGKTLTFDYAQQNDTKIVACSSASAALHEGAKVVDYTLQADGGKLTFTGTDGTFTGDYSVHKEGEKYGEYVVYKISVNGENGYASLTRKTHDDGAKEYLLLLTIMERHVQFTTGKVTG